eukprot:g237.t1
MRFPRSRDICQPANALLRILRERKRQNLSIYEVSTSPQGLGIDISAHYGILAFDVSPSHIGIAHSSDLKHIEPLPTLQLRNKQTNEIFLSSTTKKLNNLIHSQKIGGIVFGLPLSLDGQRGRQCEIVFNILDALRLQSVQHEKNMKTSNFLLHNLPLAFVDERFTTKDARQGADITNHDFFFSKSTTDHNSSNGRKKKKKIRSRTTVTRMNNKLDLDAHA